MRIVIDLQGAQASNKNRGLGRSALSLTQAMIREAGAKHEFWIALSSCLPESIEELRDLFKDLVPGERIVVWTVPCPVADVDPANHSRREVGERLREGFLASLNPDIVYVPSLFEGWGDNALT